MCFSRIPLRAFSVCTILGEFVFNYSNIQAHTCGLVGVTLQFYHICNHVSHVMNKATRFSSFLWDSSWAPWLWKFLHSFILSVTSYVSFSSSCFMVYVYSFIILLISSLAFLYVFSESNGPFRNSAVSIFCICYGLISL